MSQPQPLKAKESGVEGEQEAAEACRCDCALRTRLCRTRRVRAAMDRDHIPVIGRCCDCVTGREFLIPKNTSHTVHVESSDVRDRERECQGTPWNYGMTEC